MTQKTKGSASDLDIIIGQNLKRIRKEHGYKQQDLADMLEISYQQLQNMRKVLTGFLLRGF